MMWCTKLSARDSLFQRNAISSGGFDTCVRRNVLLLKTFKFHHLIYRAVLDSGNPNL